MSSKPNIVVSSGCLGITSEDLLEIKECNYMGLSDSTSTESSTISTMSENNSCGLNLKGNEMTLDLKATELKLGITRSDSLERNDELCKLKARKKAVIMGQKRGFSFSMIEVSEKKYDYNSELIGMPSSGNTIDFSAKSIKGEIKEPVLGANHASVANNSVEPPSNVQLVGWPPVRTFRKITKNSNEEEGKTKKSSAYYVKVSMDGAPYLRKVDLRAFSSYQDLSSGFKKMFSCFNIGKYGSHGAAGKEMMSESKLKDLLHGYEYVLTYEDKDSDLMLLGDIPWEMFVETCKRMRIMKGPDAISLAPRAMEKCLNKS